MEIAIILFILFFSCLLVFLYNKIKELEDDIDNLYNIFYEYLDSEEIKNTNMSKQERNKVFLF